MGRGWEELPFNIHSRCCLWHKCHGWRTEWGVCTCCVPAASLALREAPFHLAKLPCCCRLTPKQLICLLHKRLCFEMLKTAILCVCVHVLGVVVRQMDIACCDFRNAFGGRWIPLAEIGVCCTGKTPGVFTAGLQRLCVCGRYACVHVHACVCLYFHAPAACLWFKGRFYSPAASGLLFSDCIKVSVILPSLMIGIFLPLTKGAWRQLPWGPARQMKQFHPAPETH